MATKMVNYTPEQTLQMIQDYQSGITVEKIAENMGKTVRSVVAKLSREKVYKAKEYVSKTGEKPVKKDIHAEMIGRILNLPENDVDSLTKANKNALKVIFEALANSKPI
jgi:predicted DNA binding CopG/RHH family protein